ncbi:hypothetical protein K488DRAFT_67781 [Vararia minispora EC-137]|uniref:Uncharacterized protein n=1 Tax=Vararia minispora EC-137 TaxID=1314806 RepID=A0ACB8QXP7_9AGAM|nr:hypothetical protein K488DRAFT_67781 [Vararia minispora EC-137]
MTKRRHNDLVPISKLPLELFTEIVRLVTEASRPQRKHYHLQRRLGWLSLTHVCSSWRSRIIGLPALWASNIGIFPSAIKEMLLRAGPSSPITLHVGHDPASIRMLSEEEPDLSDRTSKIFCEYYISDEAQRRLGKLIEDSPNLSELSLRAFKFPSRPQKFPRISIPSLRVLRLQTCDAIFTSNVLVSLDISYYCRHSTKLPPLRDILEVINNARQTLETVTICLHAEVVEEAGEVSGSGDPWESSISLPNLRVLSIGDAYGPSRLLSHLVLPSTTSIDLICHTGWSDKTEARCRAALDTAATVVPDACAICLYVGDGQDPCHNRELFWLNFYARAPTSWHDAVPPTIRVCFRGTRPSLAVFRDALAAMPVHSLAIDAVHLQPAFAADLVCCFPRIRRLTVFNPHALKHDLLAALAEGGGLPDLEYLSLDGRGLRRARISCKRLQRQVEALLQQSVNFKTLRVGSNVGTYLRAGPPLEAALESLRDAVPGLEWHA